MPACSRGLSTATPSEQSSKINSIPAGSQPFPSAGIAPHTTRKNPKPQPPSATKLTKENPSNPGPLSKVEFGPHSGIPFPNLNEVAPSSPGLARGTRAYPGCHKKSANLNEVVATPLSDQNLVEGELHNPDCSFPLLCALLSGVARSEDGSCLSDGEGGHLPARTRVPSAVPV